MKLRYAFASALTATALSAGSASATTVFTASSWVPATHTLSVAQKEWCDKLEAESAGSMKRNILPKGVTAAPGTFDAVRDGLADIAFTVDGYTPGRFINTQVAEFPFLGDSATATSVAYQRIYAKYFAPLGEHRGVKVLGVFTHGPGTIFTTNKPVKSAADAASLKFRVGGGNINELAKAMGWNTTLKAAPESFELLSTGVMDGTFFPDESVASFKLSMIKNATAFPGGLYNTSFVFMMNPEKYKALSPQDKAVVDKLSGEPADAEAQRSNAESLSGTRLLRRVGRARRQPRCGPEGPGRGPHPGRQGVCEGRGRQAGLPGNQVGRRRPGQGFEESQSRAGRVPR